MRMNIEEVLEMKAQLQASDYEPKGNAGKVSAARKEREYVRGKKGQKNGGQFAKTSGGGAAAKSRIKVKKTPTGPLTVAEDSKYRRMLAAQGGYLDVSEASEITTQEIARLRAAGWTAKPGDTKEALYPPAKVTKPKELSATAEKRYRGLAAAGKDGGWDIPEDVDPEIVRSLRAAGWTSRTDDAREALYPPPAPAAVIPAMTPVQERTYLDLARRNEDNGLRVNDPATANLLARAGWTTASNADGRAAMYPPGKAPKKDEKKSQIAVTEIKDFLSQL